VTSLIKPDLGTPTQAWQYYSLHLASSFVLREFFLASNYKDCIRQAEGHARQLKSNLETFQKFGKTVPNADVMIGVAEGLSKWAIEMREHSYHEMHTHAFVGMFAAFEAGIEDTVAAIVMNDRGAAQDSSDRFKAGRYPLADWPWPRSVCIELANRLEKRAADAKDNTAPILFERLKIMFSWLGLEIEADGDIPRHLDEANIVRNVILHRYGEIGEEDARRCPEVAAWLGKVVPLDDHRFTKYYQALSGTLMSIMNAMSKSRHRIKQSG